MGRCARPFGANGLGGRRRDRRCRNGCGGRGRFGRSIRRGGSRLRRLGSAPGFLCALFLSELCVYDGLLTGLRQGAGAGVALLGPQKIVLGRIVAHRRARRRLGLGAGRGGRGRSRRCRLRGLGATGRRELAGLALFDNHRLRASMAEALPDVARFNGPLKRQRFSSARERLVGSVLGFAHSISV